MIEPTGRHRHEYDTSMLAASLSTLERVLRCFGAARSHVTVIGGLVPSLIAPDSVGDPHIGTSDVDLSLDIALAEGKTGYYEELASALQMAGFKQARDRRQSFRWRRGPIGIDFLYPTEDEDQQLRVLRRGEDWASTSLRSLGAEFAALAIGYPHLLTVGRRQVTFSTVLDGASVPDATVFVSGPAALAALKVDALGSAGRTKAKDAYDIVWTLNALGPEAAAREALRQTTGSPQAEAELRRAASRLAQVFETGRTGPVWYANFVGRSDAPPGARSVDERFAEATVSVFLDVLRRGLP